MASSFDAGASRGSIISRFCRGQVARVMASDKLFQAVFVLLIRLGIVSEETKQLVTASFRVGAKTMRLFEERKKMAAWQIIAKESGGVLPLCLHVFQMEPECDVISFNVENN